MVVATAREGARAASGRLGRELPRDTQRRSARPSGHRHLHDLSKTEMVAGRVAERGIDAVGLGLRRLDELNAPTPELLVGRLAVVGRQEGKIVPAKPLLHADLFGVERERLVGTKAMRSQYRS